MTLQDPLIIGSDDWNFHTGLSLGRAPGPGASGTPGPTVCLESGPAQFVNGVNQNQQAWIGHWVSTLDTYPTNDYGLVDLFTRTSDNAARGLVSVNQTMTGRGMRFCGVA